MPEGGRQGMMIFEVFFPSNPAVNYLKVNTLVV